MFYVYLLECTDKSTYVGATIDLDHRLRQHNGEIKGGARATGIKVEQGHVWDRILYISGFPDWKTALQFEWAFKYYSRRYPKRMYPLERRMRGLRDIMHLEKSTSKSIPYDTYPEGGPVIHWESDEAKNKYEPIFTTL